MGLQCSILGHAFEPAGVEQEREEQGSEVVTTEREIERCRRCGTERVVSENTEVTAVVDGEEVGIESEPDTGDSESDAMAGAVDRSGIEDDKMSESEPDEPAPSVAPEEIDAGVEDVSPDISPAEDERPQPAIDRAKDEEFGDEPMDPEAEDAEILTGSDEADRAPGQWPDDPLDEEDDTEDVVEMEQPAEAATTTETPDEDSLSGITVPEGQIVCPECGFRVEAHSGYREGDSCPECNAWLEAERNQ